jgi:multiple sugar transport system permease protein
MMPMAKAPLILLVLIQFTWIWNDLLFGLVLTKSESVRPIMVALAGMQGVYGASDGPSVIAATLVGSAPTLILFLVLQRYFVRGLTLGMGER